MYIYIYLLYEPKTASTRKNAIAKRYFIFRYRRYTFYIIDGYSM